jgi:3-oxo-5alpha-steroid 4-dehydrogenase
LDDSVTLSDGTDSSTPASSTQPGSAPENFAPSVVVDPAVIEWALVADVIVVGFGAAGACAALAAREAGAEVLAIDRFNGGGTTALSGGIIYAGGGTSVQREAGVEDTPEWMLNYLTREVDDIVHRTTLERFVESSPEMIDWLARYGVPFEATVCPYKTSFPNNKYYLYYSGSECSGEFAAHVPPAQRGHRVKGKGASGKQMYIPLARSADAADVRLQPHTRATRLLVDNGGRVVGVEAVTLADASPVVRRQFASAASIAAKPGIYYPPLRKRMERRMDRIERRFGRVIKLRARRGVVLSAGGYIANTTIVAHYAPAFRGGLQLGTTGDDGSGIALAVGAGAAVDRLENVSAWRFITPPAAFLNSLIVDDKGMRVIDESRYGAAIGQAMVTDHGGRGWILADARLMAEARRQLWGQSLWFQRMQSSALFFAGVRGASLHDVARKAGVDPEGLTATVEAHNHAIDVGKPDPVGKPKDFTRAVVAGPYTLLNISIKPSLVNPCPMFTLGGVTVDEKTGQVTTRDGAPIGGLYAAGRTAVGVCSNSYVSGLSLADCVFSGRRAGAHAAMPSAL